MQTVFVQYEILKFQLICLYLAPSDTELTLIQRPGVESAMTQCCVRNELSV